jgi:hypothetical protein
VKLFLRVPSVRVFSCVADLTRISHQFSTAAADPGMSTVLRLVGLLDILSSMPPGPQKLTYLHLARSAKHHARLRRLATKTGEKCGLICLIATALNDGVHFFRNSPIDDLIIIRSLSLLVRTNGREWARVRALDRWMSANRQQQPWQAGAGLPTLDRWHRASGSG